MAPEAKRAAPKAAPQPRSAGSWQPVCAGLRLIGTGAAGRTARATAQVAAAGVRGFEGQIPWGGCAPELGGGWRGKAGSSARRGRVGAHPGAGPAERHGETSAAGHDVS